MPVGNAAGEGAKIALLNVEELNKTVQLMDQVDFLELAAEIPGIYVPSFYETEYHPDGTIKSFRPINPHAKETITKELVMDMDSVPYLEKPLVPYIKVTQDRIVLEKYMDVRGGDDLRILRHAYLNSAFQTGLKNLIDLAIIGRAGENGLPPLLEGYTRVERSPLTSAAGG